MTSILQIPPLHQSATHTRKIGIIHPPPDIRTIVDKTASFVAKVGPELERKIIISNTGNHKFNFLNASDPYHAYYKHQLSLQSNAPASESTPSTDPIDDNDATSSKFRPVCKVVDPPEAEQYTLQLRRDSNLTHEELDIIKLSAQFVARNGKSFLSELTSRESNNPEFQFLKPSHRMLTLFTSLLDAYTKVLIPPDGLKENLTKSALDMSTVLRRCLHRLELEHSQENERQKVEDEKEEERHAMSMLDWDDFYLAGTIEISDDEDEDSRPMEIVKNWKRPEDRLSAEHVVSPITGQLIPVNESSLHMRFSLVDPKYKEQKESVYSETILAQDDEISRNISRFARTRPDIFGTMEEEVSDAVKGKTSFAPSGGLFPPPSGLVWNLPWVPMPNPKCLCQKHDRSTRFGCHSFMHPGPMLPKIPPPPPLMFAPSLREEPESKKRRLDDSLLVPEYQFLDQHLGPVRVTISVPNINEGNLKARELDITVPFLSETVGSLKEKIAREIPLPANKMKLSGKAGILKDNSSLAYYNVGEGETLILSIRERGGRKK